VEGSATDFASCGRAAHGSPAVLRATVEGRPLPGAVRDFSHELKAGWWLGINLSRHAIERVLEMACEVAGLKYSTELKVNFECLSE
jgi:hypothetical protein